MVCSEISIVTTRLTLERRACTGGQNLDWEEVEVLTALDPDNRMISLLQQSSLPLHIVDLDGRDCYVLHRSLQFNGEAQQRSHSPSSQAKYFARMSRNMQGFLLQYMPPFSVTSRHYHKLTTETYHNLEGECTLHIDGSDVRLRNSTVIVNPKQVHQVRTGKECALTLLVMEGDPKGLSMDDHCYV